MISKRIVPLPNASFENECENVFGQIEVNGNIPKSESISNELLGSRRVSLLSLIESHSLHIVSLQKEIEKLQKGNEKEKDERKNKCIIL